jgi:hypothetical protein
MQRFTHHHICPEEPVAVEACWTSEMAWRNEIYASTWNLSSFFHPQPSKCHSAPPATSHYNVSVPSSVSSIPLHTGTLLTPSSCTAPDFHWELSIRIRPDTHYHDEGFSWTSPSLQTDAWTVPRSRQWSLPFISIPDHWSLCHHIILSCNANTSYWWSL